jgi:hypothetical protein
MLVHKREIDDNKRLKICSVDDDDEDWSRVFFKREWRWRGRWVVGSWTFSKVGGLLALKLPDVYFYMLQYLEKLFRNRVVRLITVTVISNYKHWISEKTDRLRSGSVRSQNPETLQRNNNNFVTTRTLLLTADGFWDHIIITTASAITSSFIIWCLPRGADSW